MIAYYISREKDFFRGFGLYFFEKKEVKLMAYDKHPW
jgi:hypothetical protein